MEKKANIVFLMGMPGCGKTHWAKLISQEFALPYIDLDQEIAVHEKKSIPDIFQQDGEHFFRKLENKTLQYIIATAPKPSIISVGGGTPCFFNNLEFMQQAGVTIYLKAAISTLVINLSILEMHRPLLKNENALHEKLAAILSERKSFYEQADYIFDLENLSIETFETIIQ